jgi:predicted dithiol-disulfide oxidoreductase (DUF899 family)
LLFAGVAFDELRDCLGVIGDDEMAARDTSLAFVSRGSQDDLRRLKAKMGWEHIPWYTLTDDFDADFGVDEWHGTNAFIRDGNRVFRTGFINGRGDEQMGILGTTST